MNKEIQDLLDSDNLAGVMEECLGTGAASTMNYFRGTRKRPFTKQECTNLVSQSVLMGQLKCCERMMMFLTHSNLFDQQREFADMMYGELCMYALRLNKLLKQNYKISYDFTERDIEKDTEEYIRRYKLRQQQLEETNV